MGGYCFVNFVSTANAKRAYELLHLTRPWKNNSSKILKVVPAKRELRGREELIEKYRNKDFMHPAAPDEFKPRLYDAQGQTINWAENYPPDNPESLKLPKVLRYRNKET